MKLVYSPTALLAQQAAGAALVTTPAHVPNGDKREITIHDNYPRMSRMATNVKSFAKKMNSIRVSTPRVFKQKTNVNMKTKVSNVFLYVMYCFICVMLCVQGQ